MEMLFTQVIRPLVILAVVVAAIVAVCAVTYYGWLEYSGEMEVRRLVAQAAADEAAAERANAEAVLAPAEAAALTVERQSAVMTFYGVLTPAAVVVVAFTIMVLGLMCGFALAMVVQLKQEKKNEQGYCQDKHESNHSPAA